MHIIDGVLSMPIVVATTGIAAASVFVAIKDTEEKDIPKVAMMSSVFFIGSFIHMKIGPSSVHLLLNGIIGLILGRKTTLGVAAALILQLLLFQYGGLSSLGANIITVSIPAIIVGSIFRKKIYNSDKSPYIWGFLSGSISVILSVAMIVLLLLESNLRFGLGLISPVKAIVLAHIPLMIIEGIVTGFAVVFIMKVRKNLFDI